MKDLFGNEVSRAVAAKSSALRKSAERMAEWRKTPDYQRWIFESRERRRHLKEKYRRQKGIKSREQLKAERATAAIHRRRESHAARKHESHVILWKKERSAEWFAHRYHTDHEFNAKEKLRTQIRKLKHKDSEVYRLMSNNIKKGSWLRSWTARLGYTMSELVEHLRKTLPKGATWQQFMDGGLHIDHIVPRACFDLTNEDECRACWSLGNLRLITAMDNQAKHSKRITLL